jgi:hypothetical protein
MSERRILGLALAALALVGACSRSGLGDGVRRDISARMASAQGPLSGCYEKALQERRKLRGTMWLSFDIAAENGTFSNVAITRNEVPNPGLETCVIQTVSNLRLAEPQKSVVSVEYPIRFSPSR